MKTMIRDYWKRMKTAVVVGCLAMAALGLTVPGAHAQGVSYNPFLVQGIISPAPLLPVEFNGTGVAAFDVGNTGSTDMLLIPGQEMTLVITLSKGVPNVQNPSDPVAALAALGGDGVEWFDWTYDPAITTYRATQRVTIPGSTPTLPSRRTVTIQYRVTQNSFLGGSPSVSNGFNANLQPPPYANPQPTDDDAVSSYTYIKALDYGDAPISYGDVSHTVDLSKDLTTDTYQRYLYLGPAVDPENAYQASSTATGDDSNQTGGLSLDDEDGVTFPTLTAGQPAVIPVVATIVDEGFEVVTPRLNAWIDWNADGDFLDTGERIATNTSVAASGIVNLNITIPANAVAGPTFARFRFGPSVTAPTGLAAYGEVEDYLITIEPALAVQLADFGAVVQDDRIVVTWETVSELDNLGFNLYRGTSQAGPDTQLNSSLIPSQAPGGTVGFIYTWDDQADLVPGTTYYYWIESVDVNGVTTRSGPVNATFTGSQAVALASFVATAQPDHVLLNWETTSELDNIGFNLYRSLTEDGERTLLTNVPSQVPPGSGQGASYSYQDADVQSAQTYWYRLEGIAQSGATTLFDSVNATFSLIRKMWMPMVVK